MPRRSEKTALRALLLSLLLAAAVLPAAAAPFVEGSTSSDVVVLLDTSQSVLPWFHDITDYVVSSVVRDFLRSGDTFHLLSFGDTAQVEIAQRVGEEKDVRSILGRLYLLYPLARNTDLVSAFSYLFQYLADLPESRAKTVVIITDGVSNPAKGSPSAALTEADASARVSEIAGRIRGQGWPVYIIKVPFSTERGAAEAKGGAPAAAGQTGTGTAGAAAVPGSEGKQSGTDAQGGRGASAEAGVGTPLLDAMAQSLGAPVTDYQPDGKEETARKSLALPEATFPADLGKKGYAFSFPLSIHNESDKPVSLELDHVVTEGQDILQKKSFLTLGAGKSDTMDVSVALPSSTPEGQKQLGVELYFSDGARVSPSHGTLSFELAPNPLARLFRSGSRILLFVILLVTGLLLVLAAVLFLLRRAPKKSAEPVVRAVRESADAAAERERRAAAGVTNAAAMSPTASIPLPVAAKAASVAPSLAPASQAAPALSARTEATLPSATKTAYASPAPAPEVTATKPGSREALASDRREGMPLKAAVAKAGLPPRREKPARVKENPAEGLAPAYAARVVRPGAVQVELRVEGQNSAIGLRNVHKIPAGASKTVGGGRSEFSIFLAPVPAHAAEIHFDGERCVFVPRRLDLFPELDGPVEDCLHRDIPMLSRKGHRLVLRFHRYVAPKDRINRLLHCIESPGLFEQTED